MKKAIFLFLTTFLFACNREGFKPDLYVVPGINGEKGRIVGCTFYKALCFEAAR